MDNSKMTKHRVYAMSFASVYPHYVSKAEKKDEQKQKCMNSYVGWQDIVWKS